DRLRAPSAEMVRSVLSYLHTRPILLSTERVRVKSPDKKNAVIYSTRQHGRRFYVGPDLMGAQGAINCSVITDDYYAVVPETIDRAASELRRGFEQFV